MANYIVNGYPQPLGAKYQMRVDHAGPTSYVQFAPGSTPAGDIVNATDVGFGGFDSFGTTYAGYDTTGTYLVLVKPAKNPFYSPGTSLAGGGAATQCIVQWFTTTGGAGTFTPASTEVSAATNLSTYTVRLDFTCV
jgi:hypothetical protein